MKRQTITQYIRANYEPGSEPSRATVIRWIKDGRLKGFQAGAGGPWYVTGENFTGDQGLADLFDEFDQEAAQYVDGPTAH